MQLYWAKKLPNINFEGVSVKYLLLTLLTITNLACVKKSLKKPNETISSSPHTNSEKDQISEMKGLYLSLGEQLAASDSQVDRDLAKLATALGKSSDEELKFYLSSNFVAETAELLDQDQKENENKEETDFPEIIMDDSTRYAAIALTTFGGISLASSLATFKPLQMRGYAAFGVGISAIVAGSLLMQDQSEENKKGAEDIALSAGVIAVVLGLGSAKTAAQTKWNLQKPEVMNRLLEVRANNPAAFSDAGIAQLRKLGLDNSADMFQWVNVEVEAAEFAKMLNQAKKAGQPDYTSRSVLELDKSQLEKIYRKSALKFHPDRGGKTARFQAFGNSYEKVKSAPNFNAKFNSRIGWGFLAAGLGGSLIYASQTQFKLADAKSSPIATLKKLNKLILDYKQ